MNRNKCRICLHGHADGTICGFWGKRIYDDSEGMKSSCNAFIRLKNFHVFQRKNLEELVPPLELCKKIPAGEFTDSCFVRMGKKPYTIIERRLIRKDVGKQDGVYTAPTLQEILARFSIATLKGTITKLDGTPHKTGEVANSICGVLIGEIVTNEPVPTNATAALKLWLKLTGFEE